MSNTLPEFMKIERTGASNQQWGLISYLLPPE